MLCCVRQCLRVIVCHFSYCLPHCIYSPLIGLLPAPPPPTSHPTPKAGYPAWGRSRGKNYSKHRWLDFPWAAVISHLPVIIALPKTHYKSSFCSYECEAARYWVKLLLSVFNIPVDHFRLDKINIPDTPSWFPVTVPANNSSCQETGSPRCQIVGSCFLATQFHGKVLYIFKISHYVTSVMHIHYSSLLF